MFDLDGTLVDSFADIHAALSSGLLELGFPTHDLAAVTGMIGHGMRNLVEKALPPEHTREQEDALIESTLRHYRKNPCQRTVPFPGMVKLLQKIHPKATLGIFSNKPHQLTLQVAEGCKLTHLMQHIQGQREGIAIKPDPEGLWSFIPKSEAQRVLLVGDGEADAQLSANAAIRFIGVAWGTSPTALLQPYGPVAETMAELELLIDCALHNYNENGNFQSAAAE